MSCAADNRNETCETSATRRSSWTRWWRWLGPLLLLAMLWRIGPGKCWAAVAGADPWWFLAACLLSVPALVFKAYRWQEIARSVGAEFSLSESMGLYAAGMLAGAVTPGKIGDLAKAPLLAARGVPLRDGLVASLLDRLLDGVVLLALGLGCLFVLPALPGREAIAGSAAIGLALTAAAALAFRSSIAGVLRLAGIGSWLIIAVTTLGSLAPYFGSAYFCSRALGLPLGIVDITAGASVAAMLALLPVSVAGIGTRDAAFVLIFTQRGTSAEQAIALSSLILAWMLANCVLFYLVSRLWPLDARPAASIPSQRSELV